MGRDIKGLTVAFQKDLTDEYVDRLIQAISLFAGVYKVEKNVADVDDYINRKQIEFEYRTRLQKALE